MSIGNLLNNSFEHDINALELSILSKLKHTRQGWKSEKMK